MQGITATINAPLSFNNTTRTINVDYGAATYDLVEGPQGQFVAGGPLGQYNLVNALGTPVVDLAGDNTQLTQNNEVQELSINGSVSGFTLTYNGMISSSISTVGSSVPNIAQAIQSQLQSWFGAGNVIVSGVASGAGTAAGTIQSLFYLTFVNQLAGTSVAPVQVAPVIYPVYVNPVGDPNFATPTVASYLYGLTGLPWVYDSTSGIVANGSWSNTTAPVGTQVGFLNCKGPDATISQSLTLSAGTYVLSFVGAQWSSNTAPAPVELLVDGSMIGTVTPTNTSWISYQSPSFTVAAGTHTIEFLSPTESGNNVAFLSEVLIQPPGTPTNPTYSQVSQIAFPYQPFAGNWTISLDGQTTGTLPPNATATQVQTALNNLTVVQNTNGSGAVTVTTTTNAYTYSITFNTTDAWVGRQLQRQHLGPQPDLAAGHQRHQRRRLGHQRAGHFRHQLGAADHPRQQRHRLPDRLRQPVQRHGGQHHRQPHDHRRRDPGGLGAIPGIGINDVTVTATSTTASQTIYTVTFKNMLGAANLGQIGLTNVTGATYASTVETIQLPGVAGPTAGSWTITYNQVTTPTMANNATAAQVQSSLQSLGSIGGEGGSVSVTTSGNAWTYQVTFTGTSLAPTGMPLVVNINNLTTGEPSQLQPALVSITAGSGTSVVQYGIIPTNLGTAAAAPPILNLGSNTALAPPAKAP